MDSEKGGSWWAVSGEHAVDSLDTDADRGLSPVQVLESRTKHGVNVTESAKPARAETLLLGSLRQPMILLLLAIAGLSVVFGKYLEAIVMALVLLAYVAVEFINKFRTDLVMSRLNKLTLPTTMVIRDGKTEEISTEDLVVGDVIELSPGFKVPADARLVETAGLLMDEASLTGESQPVHKDACAVLPEDTPVPDRANCVYAGTAVFDGEGKAVVTAVGEKSELGRIATGLHVTGKGRTVLQQSMTTLAEMLAILAIAVSLLIPAIGFLRGLDFQQMILTWLALTFLMIPGQPPIIIQMALALASFELARKSVVVKRLQGAESLGSVDAILTDKTGTLTESRMKLEKILLADGSEVPPEAVSPDVRETIVQSLPAFRRDPTDAALAEAFPEASHSRERPAFVEGFSRGRQYRGLTYRNGSGEYLHVISGNPELLIEHSRLSGDSRERLKEIAGRQAGKGKRVIAVTAFQNRSEKIGGLEGLDFVALAVLADPVRPEVKGAVSILKKAGITTYVVTGDSPATAKSVADAVGLEGKLVTGPDLESTGDGDLRPMLADTRIFARVTPAQKLQLVQAAQNTGLEVAYVGDGINDAAALKAANVGVAMGKIGTDVAKETADLVLTDDNYAHLADAVCIGRKAIDNFRKGLAYYLTAKAVLLSVFIVPLILGIPFPLAPIQIIIVELLMDLASSTIFVTEPAEPDVMQRPPMKIRQYIGFFMAGKILRSGIGLAAGMLAVYLWLYHSTGNLILAQTAAFVTWLPGHILLALNMKQERLPLLKQGLMSNKFGVLWLAGMVVLAVVVTVVPAGFPVLKTAPLSPITWAMIIIVIIISTCWIEVWKWMVAEKRR